MLHVPCIDVGCKEASTTGVSASRHQDSSMIVERLSCKSGEICSSISLACSFQNTSEIQDWIGRRMGPAPGYPLKTSNVIQKACKIVQGEMILLCPPRPTVVAAPYVVMELAGSRSLHAKVGLTKNSRVGHHFF